MNFSIPSTEKTVGSLDYNSDESEFEGSRLDVSDIHTTDQIYVSTNLITEEVESIADVFINFYSPLDITKMKSDMIRNMKRGVRSPKVFDPKTICNQGA
jgi:hypothetical protein